MAGILSELRIVEVSAFIAAPLGGMTLAQLGADVIRIDPCHFPSLMRLKLQDIRHLVCSTFMRLSPD